MVDKFGRVFKKSAFGSSAGAIFKTRAFDDKGFCKSGMRANYKCSQRGSSDIKCEQVINVFYAEAYFIMILKKKNYLSIVVMNFKN